MCSFEFGIPSLYPRGFDRFAQGLPPFKTEPDFTGRNGSDEHSAAEFMLRPGPDRAKHVFGPGWKHTQRNALGYWETRCKNTAY